jgi:hypothetical protein
VPIGGLDVTNDVHCDGKAESCEEVVSYNTESYDTILARELGPAKAVTFTLTAPNDAHIGFFSKGKSLDEVYEVVLGGWGGTQSVIRRSNQGDNEVVAATPDIVSAEEPREFWADVRQGVVRVGTTHEVGDESSIVMQWKDPNPFEATYVGFMSGWGAEGHWKVCFDAGIADAPTETYIGCYEDSSERDVEVNMGRMEESTVEQCATLCESSAYFALQDGEQHHPPPCRQRALHTTLYNFVHFRATVDERAGAAQRPSAIATTRSRKASACRTPSATNRAPGRATCAAARGATASARPRDSGAQKLFLGAQGRLSTRTDSLHKIRCVWTYPDHF